MKIKKIIFILTVLFLGTNIFAEDIPPVIPIEPITTHLSIATNSGAIYDQDITVAPCDNDQDINTTETLVTPYCAILQINELASDWSWFGSASFLNTLNDITGFTSTDKDGNDVYHYWSWSLNGEEAMMALNQYELKSADLISLNFIDPISEIEITPIVDNHTGGGGSNKNKKQNLKTEGEVLGSTIEKISFNQNSALNFLIMNQNMDGSFGEDIYTDWVAVALGNTPLYKLNTNALKQYLINNKTAGTLLTDYERRAMAILALGLNPYDINGENYINKIVNSFDGKQFGDINEDNDDIFALIVLQNAGYKSDEKMIFDDISFILNKQKENGSWDESVDMTGAALQALNAFDMREDVKNAITKAKEYLEKTQKDTGGWNNVSSTSWVWGGLSSIQEKEENWVKSELTPNLYLGANQDIDGSMKNENLKNKIWETAYALTAMSGKSWNDILEDVPKNLTTPKPIPPAPKKILKTATIKKTLTEVIVDRVITNPVNPTPDLPIKIIEKKSWFRRLFGF